MKRFFTLTFIAFLLIAPIKTLIPAAIAQSWLWGRGEGASGIDAWAVATDNAGNVWGGGIRFDAAPVTFGGSYPLPPMSGGGYQAMWAKYSSTGAVLWADATSVGSTYLHNLVTDVSGNVILFGAFSSPTMQIGSITLTNFYSDGSSQFFIAKISPTGAVIWAINDGEAIGSYMYMMGAAIMTAGGVTTDNAGNIYVTSAFRKPSITIGTTVLNNTDVTGLTHDIFVAKYDPSGAFIWASSVGGAREDYSFGLTHASTGNVYITGTFNSPAMSVGTSVLSDPFTQSITYIAKFSGSTGAPLWGQAAGGSNGAFGVGLASDNYGNVYMTGGFGDASISFGSTTVTRTYPGAVPQLALFLVQYSSADAVTWNKTIGSASLGAWGWSIALASCGQIWVSGNYNQDADVDGNNLALVPGPDPIFITGYDLSGGVVGYSGLASGGDDQNGISCDGAGNVYMCSDYFAPTTIGPDVLTGGFSEYFYMAKYANSIVATDTTFTTHDTSACGIDSMLLRAPAGYTAYVWDDGSVAATHWVYSTGMHYVTSVTCGLTVRSDTFNVTFLPADTLYTTRDTFACSSIGSMTLYAPPGYTTYNWNTGSTSSSIVVSTSDTFISYATVGCSMQADTIRVVFWPTPVVSLGADTAFCVGNTLTLRSPQPAGSNYAWSTGSTADTLVVTSTGTYTLTVTNSDGCSANDARTVTISPYPVVDLGPDTIRCDGAAVTLQSSVTYPTGTVYLWNTGSTTATAIAPITGTYWERVTYAGCTSADTIQVQIIYDTLNFQGRDTSICRGQSVVVYAAGAYGMTYQWLPTAGVPVSTTATTLITPDTSATYTLTTSLAGCNDITASFHIDVQPNPIVNLHSVSVHAVCEKDTLIIRSSVQPAWYTHYIYSWSPGVNLDDSTKPVVVFKPGDSTLMILTVSTPAGCKGTDSTLIIVHPGNFATLDTTIRLCPHDSVILIPMSTDDLTTYRWHPGIYLNDSMISSPWAHPITSQHYYAVATSRYGCLDTVHANIFVSANADIHLGDSVTIYPGESYEIPTQSNCTSFTWFPPSGLSNIHVPNPVASPEVSTKYIVYGYTDYGCPAKDSINIYVSPETLLDLPNAFAPGNGPNNTFKVIRRGIAELTYFRIFNRWGNLVFETTNIDEGWDGTYNGKPQPFGVFVYQVEAVAKNGRPFMKTGNVTLIR